MTKQPTVKELSTKLETLETLFNSHLLSKAKFKVGERIRFTTQTMFFNKYVSYSHGTVTKVYMDGLEIKYTVLTSIGHSKDVGEDALKADIPEPSKESTELDIGYLSNPPAYLTQAPVILTDEEEDEDCSGCLITACILTLLGVAIIAILTY